MLKIAKEDYCYKGGFEDEWSHHYRATVGQECIAYEESPEDLVKRIDPHYVVVKGAYLLVHKRQMYYWKPYDEIFKAVTYGQLYDLVLGPLEEDLEKFQKETEHKKNQVKDLVFRSVTGR